MHLLRNKIQEHILKYKTNRINHTKEFVSFEDIRDAIVLYDSSLSSEGDVIEFKKMLSSNNIKCTLLKYVTLMNIEETNINVNYVCDNDISIKGDLVDSTINDLYTNEYDVLFDLRASSNYFTDYLSKKLKSRFIVACSPDLKEADLLISTEGDMRQFMDLSIEYLKKLRN